MKIIYLIIGIISLGIGIVGVILPVLPTTPFMLLTSFCLLKSSDRLNDRFQRTKFYEEHVKSFKENRGMTMKAKMSILIPVSIMLLTMFVLIDSSIMRGIIVVLLTVKIIVFSRMKTIK
ncbi:YbaN family protein [Oceanirhabdus sp. W0125-5]|uniref:YbaN family protein n=1 Tax=Oceanirhabdus sp. W0125-5 TaxID=2999116 RepID=UPI0022F2DCFE|nr:YbaN family protein [Oceanirhabdus sp. W0125-5]WBW96753.1 YbaN family protein [Oceanirhabdus sp. W0125-5]